MTTTWRPDTCDCVIEYDDKINVVAVHKRCAKHSGTLNDGHHLETVLTHNRKKNHVRNGIAEHIGDEKAAASLHVAYDDKDDLHVHGHGLSDADQKAAHAKVAHHLGASALHWMK